MSAPTNPRSLPDGFRLETSARARFAVRRDFEAALLAVGFGPESDGELRVSALSGRKPLYELDTPQQGKLLVRRFSHGGLLRFATGRRFLDSERPFEEIRLASHLEAAGIRTPEIVAARARRAAIAGFELDLVTRRVEDTIDLGWMLGMARRGEIDAACLRLVCAAVGVLVAKLHAIGFLHADLTPNNLLVHRSVLEGADPVLWVLDLDRARIVARPTDEERRANLRRLFRFVARREERDGRVLEATDYARFFLGYDPTGLAWKDDWRAIEREHADARFAHKIGWALESIFGRGRDARERVHSTKSSTSSMRMRG